MVERVGYDNVFVFRYSRRPGTPAATMPDQVAEDVKAEPQQPAARGGGPRERRAEPPAGWAGRWRCWWTARRKKNAGELSGRTRCNRVVNFDGQGSVAVGDARVGAYHRGAAAQPAWDARVPTGGGRMFVEMKVRGLALDAVSNMPIIILRDEEDKRSLPIWVGIFEANAIALELEKIAPARPMTHDLIKNILETLEARVLKVVVTDLKENTFFAVLHLQLGEAEYTVDSRPSDAIALALRVAAPIYVDEEVVRKAKSLEVTQGGRAHEGGRPRAAPRVAAEHQAGGFREVQQGLTGVCRCGSRSSPTTTCRSAAASRSRWRRSAQGLEAARPRGVGLRPALARRRTDASSRIVRYPSIPAATYPGVRAGRAVLARGSAACVAGAGLRRLPRPPSLPARAGRPPAGAPGPAAAGLHLPHALREVRALRPAARSASWRRPRCG